MARSIRFESLHGEVVEEKALSNRESLASLLYAELRGLSLAELAGEFTTRLETVRGYDRLRRGLSGCENMSLLYNPHRLAVPSGGKTTVVEALKKEGFAKQVARLYLEGIRSKRLSFLQAIQAGTYGVQYASDFPPLLARNLCRHYARDRRSKVLDPCGGWGGRMIGASTVCDYYLCFEPSTQTALGLKRLGKTLSSWSNGFRPRVKCLPFEDACLPNNYFDFAFTSPPYFDTEKYADEETQSYIRYPSFDLWCEGFFHPLIDKTLSALKVGRYFILNVAGRKHPLNERLEAYCEGRYHVAKVSKRLLSGASGGLGKSGAAGEVFYAIRKTTASEDR